MKFINPFLVIFLLCSPLIQSQKKKKSSKKSVELNKTYNNLNWRNIGPFRGGRSVTSEGVVKEPSTFYMW